MHDILFHTIDTAADLGSKLFVAFVLNFCVKSFVSLGSNTGLGHM